MFMWAKLGIRWGGGVSNQPQGKKPMISSSVLLPKALIWEGVRDRLRRGVCAEEETCVASMVESLCNKTLA